MKEIVVSVLIESGESAFNTLPKMVWQEIKRLPMDAPLFEILRYYDTAKQCGEVSVEVLDKKEEE